MANGPAQDSAELPAAYQRWRASELGRITDTIEEELILDLVGPLPGKRVLDVGCGDGALSVLLAGNGVEVTGLDIDPRMLDAARRRATEANVRAHFVAGNAAALPFAKGSFDIVTAIAVLCFVPDPDKVFGEMTRVLRPGGRLVVGELGRHSLWAVKRRIAGWLGSNVWGSARFRTADELKRLAAAAGIEVEAVHGAVYYPPCNLCARWLSSIDGRLSRLTSFGAAFIALVARKPLQASEEQP
jgi:ubiquinone biosynthesis O-methyltransferase